MIESGRHEEDRCRRPAAVAVLLLLLFASLQPSAVAAQIVRDGSVGPPCVAASCALTGPTFAIGSELGQLSVGGSNLFHSFSRFNIRTGQSATFSGPASVDSIISRVTGTQQSFIDGLLRSTISGADFYLINPRGVVFGPNATLDVGGSFHVSTADYLRFADRGQFFANLSSNSALSAAPPAAFGFVSSTPAGIEIRGSALRVPEQQALSIVGGDILIAPSEGGLALPSLTAPGGRIQIASVRSQGNVVPAPLGSPARLGVSSFGVLGRIDISATTVDVSEVVPTGAGTVMIRGGQLFIGASSITSNVSGDVSGDRLGIDLRSSGEMALTGGTSLTSQTSLGAARGGDINLAAENLRIDGSSVANTALVGTGSAGDVSVTAQNLTLANGGAIQSQNISVAPARGGNITIEVADSITMSASAGILSATVFDGPGGDVTVSGRSLTMDGASRILSAASGAGEAGAITLTTDRLSVTGGASIGSSGGSTGPGGPIVVEAGSILLSGEEFGNISGIFTSSGGAPVGPIALTTGTLTVRDGARIQSGSILAARAGEIGIDASGDVVIANGGGILSQTFDQAVGAVSISAGALTLDNGFITTSTLGPGQAGGIEVGVGTLLLRNGGQIVSSSELLAEGNGGSITVTASGSISISGTSPTGVPASPFSSDASSGIFSTTAATGNAGQIAVSTPILVMDAGGQLSVATTGTGTAGDILLDVGDVSLSGGARIDSGTTAAGQGGTIMLNASTVTLAGGAGLFSNTVTTGIGGDINIAADAIHLRDGGIVSATSTGTPAAVAGDISIVFGDTLELRNSSITTASLQAPGGNISITSTGSRLHLTNSRITTSVRSDIGEGGNITIGAASHPINFVVLDGSEIRADAFGGPGGNIGIFADVYLTTDTVVSASSALSTPGTIDVRAGVTDVSGTVKTLPETAAEAATLLRASCTARLAEGKSSSLVVAGRGGVPPEPQGLLWSPVVAEPPAGAAPSRSEGQQSPISLAFLRASLDPKCAR